jgi:hypothetical protein
MANGYLGKISAIVSANTADFDSKLSKSAAEVKKFAGSMEGSLTSARSGAGTALRGIYTDAQRLQRALTAAATQKLSFSAFKGIKEANLAEAIKQMQAVYSVSQQIGKPLAGAAKTMSGLSAGVQAEFLPAMIRAQTATEKLSETIDRTGTAGVRQFEAVEKQVTKTVAAMSRMKEAGAMVSGLATGQELRFQRPELSSEMQRSAALQSQAAQMSPAAISSSGVAGLVAQQRAAAIETERLAAALERESLLINGNVTEATAAYQSQLAVQRRVNDELERQIQLEANIGASTDISNIGQFSRRENRRFIGASTSIRDMGARTDITGYGQSSSLEERRRSLATSAMGSDIEAPRRQLSFLEGGITSLKGRIDTLPSSLRVGFVPAIRAAEQEFIRLSTSASPLPEQINAARQRMVLLTQQVTRAARALSFAESFGGRGVSGIRLGLDERALRGYEGSLTALQTALTRTQATARGPAVAAFNALRNAIAEALGAGTLEEPATRQRIQRLQAAAVQATSQAGGGSVRGIQTAMRRAGDVSRNGVDRLSLGINQLAFAFDDFMSSTGGWDQKLRAISNNITQLGFVTGGTTGLFVSLGAVIAGQAAVGIYKWINGGRTAEDQTKALNDSLAKQKSLVEDLAQSFKSLADAMSEGTFSGAGKKSADINRQMEDIRKKQVEFRKERVSETDTAVQRERGEQNRLNREMEKETDPGLRAAQAAAIRESKDREKRAMDAAAARAANRASQDDVRRVAGGSIRATEFLEGGRMTVRSAEEADRRRGRLEESIAGANGDPAELARIVRERIDERNQTAIRPIGITNFEETPEIYRAREDVRQLEQLLASLQDPIREAIDTAANDIADSTRGPAETIRNAQNEVAEAIKAGLPGARLFGLELDKTAKAMQDAFKKLEKAAEESDPEKKRKLVAEAQANVADLQARRADIERQADALRYERTVESQRQSSTVMDRSRGNLGASGLENGQLARRMREIENQRETIRQQAAMEEHQNPMSQRLFEQSEAALNREVVAIEAATLALKMFAEALSRASEEAKGNLNSAQQAADEARRADLGTSTERTQEARKRAESDLENQRNAAQDAQRQIDNERARQEEEARAGNDLLMRQRENGPRAEAARKASDASDFATKMMKDAGIEQTGSYIGNAAAARAAGREDVALAQEAARAVNQESSRVFGDISNGFWQTVTAALEEAEKLAQEAEATFADEFARMREIDEQLASGSMSASDQEALRNERAGLMATVEPAISESRRRAEKAIEASTREEERRKSANRGSELGRNSDEKFAAETQAGMTDIKNYYEGRAEANNGFRPAGDAEAQAEAEKRYREEREKEARTATRAGRGREAFLTDRERFARDSREGIVRDMTEGAIDQAGVMNVNGRRALLEKGIKNQMKEVAPMLQAFEEERQTALLQGPSRKALQVSDVSTSQGASELTRLIRGDDSAKDVNLAELRKQTQKFDALIEIIKQQNPGVLL